MNNQSSLNENSIGQNDSLETVSAIQLDSLPLGMAYVPMQTFSNISSISEALKAGTIFSDLNLPFEGK